MYTHTHIYPNINNSISYACVSVYTSIFQNVAMLTCIHIKQKFLFAPALAEVFHGHPVPLPKHSMEEFCGAIAKLKIKNAEMMLASSRNYCVLPLIAFFPIFPFTKFFCFK